ncbi:hypothetical protein [Corynebacterium sp. LaCa116]|uniref:hypothetical protein n=1 Tax=Corynebacterium sp. LaCa116 TaxID=3391423 RepID=UPI00398A43D3
MDIPDEWYKKNLASLAPQLASKAQAVAGAVEGDVPVTVTMKTDRHGRPVALVTLAHAKGLAMQAKRGTLTRAAASQGLDVHRYRQG